MSKFYKSTINIGGTPKTVVQIQHEKEEAKGVTIDQMHHLHLIDRSGSMSPHINNLIEQVKLTLKVIPETDLFSLGWFSGKGQYKFVVKGMAPNNPKLGALLDELKHTVGSTCFREILTNMGEVVNDTAALCPNFNVTLFTDGEPCCDLSDAEEITRAIAAVKNIAPKLIAFNTIGYGHNYNQEMLKDLAALTQYGVATHSLKITEYLDIWKHNYEIINELVSDSVEIAAPEIIYLNRKFAKLSTDHAELKSLDKSKNMFFLIGPDDKDFKFTYNGTVYNSADITTAILKANVTNVLYALIATKYAKGERRAAIEIAHKSLKNKHLIDLMMSAFTMDEIELATRELNKAVVIPSSRVEDEAPADYLPDKNTKTVIDVLGVLAATGCLYVPDFKNYSAVGIKTKDNYNLFTPDKVQKNSPFGDFVFSKEKLNMNLRFTVSGTVALNPKQAKEVGLPATVPAVKFRNHTIIKDGVLNMSDITALVPKAQYEFVSSYIGFLKCGRKPLNDNPDYVEMVIHLDQFPIINLSYAEMAKSIESVMTLVYGELICEAKAKVLKYFLKSTEERPSTSYTVYTPAQEALLKQHGVVKGVYNTIAPSQDKEAIDYYDSRTLEMYIKGASSLPSISDIEKAVKEGKTKKTANPAYQVMIDLYKQCEKVTIDDISHVHELVKKELAEIRTTLAAVKLAKVYSGDWFTGLEKGDKGEWLYNRKDGVTMVLKTERIKVPFSIPTED